MQYSRAALCVSCNTDRLHLPLQLHNLLPQLQRKLLPYLHLIVSSDTPKTRLQTQQLTFNCKSSKLLFPSIVPMKNISPPCGCPPCGEPNVISFFTGVLRTTLCEPSARIKKRAFGFSSSAGCLTFSRKTPSPRSRHSRLPSATVAKL